MGAFLPVDIYRLFSLTRLSSFRHILVLFIDESDAPMSSVKKHPATPLSQLFFIFLKLGFTAFGGPVAHLAFFREAFVEKRQWLTDAQYAELVALCQFLPGPASSQVGLAIGLMRGGVRGALLAWAGFTLPSALFLMATAVLFSASDSGAFASVLHGLKLAAVAVVIHALIGMGRSLCPTLKTRTLALASALVLLVTPPAYSLGMQFVVIGVGALFGFYALKGEVNAGQPLPAVLSRTVAFIAIGLLLLGLIGLPIAARVWPNEALMVIDTFFRVGSLVFGGGHVVLPMLETETVSKGMISADAFLAGYGLVQAVPGPIFTFSAFLGALLPGFASPWIGALVCLIAMFLPSFLMVFALLPFWANISHLSGIRRMLAGVNAVVVGLLASVLINPIATNSLHSVVDVMLTALIAIALFKRWLPVWALVLLSAGAGALLF
jgi:chromate transporter